MVFLIDYVLPESYFARNLQALSVDVAVFRDLLALRQPRLAGHLQQLQQDAGECEFHFSSGRAEGGVYVRVRERVHVCTHVSPYVPLSL